jgi:hypothetical protein
MAMTLHPNTYAVLSRKLERAFHAFGKVEVAIAAVALPLLVARFSAGWRWSLHAFVALAALALLLMLAQGALESVLKRANYAAGEWMTSTEQTKDEAAVKSMPRKGFRTPAKKSQCPCSSGKKYEDCCRPRQVAMVRALQ